MEVIDKQVSDIIGNMELPQTWQLQVMDVLNSLDEKVSAARERDHIEEKLRRLKRLYLDLELEESQYEMERNRLEVSLASIAVPQENAIMTAGQELAGMLEIWDQATEEEKSHMLRLMLEAVYCDTEAKAIIVLKPKAPFLPLFSLCQCLTEKDGLFFTSAFAGIGDPGGDRVHIFNIWKLDYSLLSSYLPCEPSTSSSPLFGLSYWSGASPKAFAVWQSGMVYPMRG